MTLSEAAFGRRFETGEAALVSPDEHLFLGLMDGSKPARDGIECATGVLAALDCALRSARIMIALTLEPRVARAPRSPPPWAQPM